MIHGHGGNIFQAARNLGCRPEDILDMSSNFNPLGSAPGLMDQLHASLGTINNLPEVDAGHLAQCYARVHGCLPGQVLAGSGTTQFIYQLPRALGSRRAVICGPTYADYQDACVQQQAQVTFVMATAESDFQPDLHQVATAARQADLVFICNPNNPTGTLWRPGEIEDLARAHGDTWIVVDESYLPMALNGDRESLISKVPADLPNVIVLDSCSKIYRIPGLRIGFLKAAEAVIERVRTLAMPWSVNSLALAAGEYLVARHPELRGFIQTTRRFLEEQKRAITNGLARINGLKIFPSHASYLLLRLPEPRTSAEVCDKLLAQRILIRDCANFAGLSQRYVRVSLKDAQANQTFVARFREVLNVPV
ncbi:MAG: threonine-phosphate decarboxylase [Desulfobacterales bacterium]